VHQIVDKLGGQVGVESELGQGSLFFFTLPANPAAEPAYQSLIFIFSSPKWRRKILPDQWMRPGTLCYIFN
jgi:hypothetical protein